MYICFSIACKNCSCKFELKSNSYVHLDRLQCQNCKQEFPSAELQKLNQAMSDVESIAELCGDTVSGKGFLVQAESIWNDELPF